MTYIILRHYKNILSRLETDGAKKKIEDKISEMKKQLRAENRAKMKNNNRKVIKDYGIDGFIELIQLPEEIKTKEDAVDWFEYNEYREMRPCAYDCTGQLFTGWFKIFQRNGRFIAYHCVNADV